MPRTRALLITTLVSAPPAYYAYYTLHRLETEYPALDPTTHSTTSLRATPNPHTQHTPHIDVYGARVPLRTLLEKARRDGCHCATPVPPNATSPEDAWARFFLQSRGLRSEGRLAAAGSKLLNRDAGDAGECGFQPGQELLNGVFGVVRAPGRAQPLLLSWAFPARARGACEALARWGYPWRFMSGGRHELGVGEVDKEGMVEVRFASAHDYEVVDEEGERQKTIPAWTGRLHRAWARWLLDERVRRLRD
ncbi:uncharacterized protein K452DRAFT_292522 [Aplosporella prunicola CBS 121167]|uniref:Uncharacterized protein n=1 Tax=Aplosporella prunicola CBS 121167 TaxID=1176127 RepID=A0A6A6AXJ0_9PEZI|nr:uncharacterized protein K452DRAFT_292522 [Aplosporella prunicola CBS 121167]KAF2136326.1 hypothetical protein K452DRAFT_292522 [Aplosporella prunicola CBS 121167]